MVAEPERRAFLLANIVSEQLAFRFFKGSCSKRRGNLIEGMQALTAIAPLLIVLVALHLRVSQSGALAQMVAGNLPGNDRHGSGEFAQH